MEPIATLRLSLYAPAMRWTCTVALLLACSTVALSAEDDFSQSLRAALTSVDPQLVPSGFLIDRTLPLVLPERFDGSARATELAGRDWRQLLHQFHRASDAPPSWLRTVAAARAAIRGEGPIPIGVLDFSYQALLPSALHEGKLDVKSADVATRQLFAASALRDRSYRGFRLSFVLPREWYLSETLPERLQIDFDDGRGWREATFDQTIEVSYTRVGKHRLRLRASDASGVRHAEFAFFVEALLTPSPDDTLQVTGAPYLGSSASGDAFVYLAPGHSSIQNPAVVIEGFDLDDSMNWDELYALLNQENLVEDLRALGFDAIVFNFDNATQPMQRNGLLVAELLTTIHAQSPAPFALVGASMGGLCARYALCQLEAQAIEHGVGTFISFDVPHRGANIPLGVQHWVSFFADQSADAEFLLSRLDTPAARQMLLYHHASTSGNTAAADPLRAAFLSDLAALGDFPQAPRLVAVANGSGSGVDQGFAPGQQIIEYEYDSAFVDVTGNVYAVPDGGLNLIFAGRLWVFLLVNESQNVSVSGTAAWDGAPGGRRGSMAQMDSTQAPYGDIVALHQNHCFIPTISALGLDSGDPFYDVDGDLDLLSHTPFDAVYYPTENQDHVAVTAQSKLWFLDEIQGTATDTPAIAASDLRWLRAAPNPFNPATILRFELGQRLPVSIDVFDARGRHVDRLLQAAQLDPGVHDVPWRPDGRLASGVYRLQLRAGANEHTQSIVLFK